MVWFRLSIQARSRQPRTLESSCYNQQTGYFRVRQGRRWDRVLNLGAQGAVAFGVLGEGWYSVSHECIFLFFMLAA